MAANAIPTSTHLYGEAKNRQSLPNLLATALTAAPPAVRGPAAKRGSLASRPPACRDPIAWRRERRVEVREVRTRRDLETFVQFPWSVYEGDANWSPPLLVEAKAFLDRRKHPFYLHGEATQFLAHREGQVVGRVLVSDDPNYNAQHGVNQGCFGMFECIDDRNVAAALLNRAADWLRRRGRTEMVGPIDYSTNYPCGALIDGFETPQRVMMNHNPRYYPGLYESWGLAKAKDLYAWWFDDSLGMLERWARRAERIAERGEIRVRPVNFRDFDAEVERCLRVYNETWEQSWGFVRMTNAEFRHMAQDLKRFAVPEMVLLAECGDEPIGFCVTLPDFNEATRPLNGRLTKWGLPIGLGKLMLNMKRIRSGRMAVLGVLERFRRRGVTELFILKALEHGRNVLGYDGAELGWTLEDNDLINSAIEKVGGRRYKRFRIYQTAL